MEIITKRNAKTVTLEDIYATFELAPEFAIRGSGLKWKAHRFKNRIGLMAGSFDTHSGYYKVKIKGKDYKAHHVVATLSDIKGWPEVRKGSLVIDHINGPRSDNRTSNLRCVTQQVNSQNQQRHRDGAVNGVHKTPSGNYVVQLRINGVRRSFGTHPLTQALRVRNEVRQKYHV